MVSGDDWPLKGRKTKPPGRDGGHNNSYRPRKFVVYGRVCLLLLELAERSIEAWLKSTPKKNFIKNKLRSILYALACTQARANDCSDRNVIHPRDPSLPGYIYILHIFVFCFFNIYTRLADAHYRLLPDFYAFSPFLFSSRFGEDAKQNFVFKRINELEASDSCREFCETLKASLLLLVDFLSCAAFV